MTSLTVTSKELWPIQAREILDQKCINTEQLKEIFYQVLYPWDPEYSNENTYFSLRIQQRPLIIIKPCNLCQIEEVLNFVNRKKLTVRIMNGRHSTQIVSPEVLVDISFFNQINICDDKIRCGGGCTQGAANEALFSHDKCVYSHFGHFTHGRFCRDSEKLTDKDDTESFAGGSAATVGTGGISTVGGIGVLCRSFGLTIDSVISYEIVIPPTLNENSRCVIADKYNNTDLYWALRGGGGNNFGIISSIEYDIVEVPKIIQYSVSWPWENASKVLSYWKHSSSNRPNNYNEEIGLSQGYISLNGYYVFENSDNIEEAVRKIQTELCELINLFSGSLIIDIDSDYSQIYKNLVKTRTYSNFSVIQAFFIDDFSSKAIVEYISYRDKTGNRSISFQLLGGVIRDVSKNSTAFYPREANFFMDISSKWDNQENSEKNNDWVNIVVKCVIKNRYNKIMYLGFPISYSNIHINNNMYYGDNYDRLKEIKRKYDPLNVLTFSGTIR